MLKSIYFYVLNVFMFLFYNCTRITSVTLTISKPCLGDNFHSVSIQAQPFRYQSQPGHNPPGSKCHTGTQA